MILSLAKDALLWQSNLSQLFYKDLYLKVEQRRQGVEACSFIWKFKIPIRIKLFPWKLVNHILPVRGFLSKRLPGINKICP